MSGIRVFREFKTDAFLRPKKIPTFLVNNIFSDFSLIEPTEWVHLNRLLKKFYENKGHMSEDFVAYTTATDQSIHILFNRD